MERTVKNILVTGGAGFIGSHLCLSLIDKGDRVTCIDNLSTGNERNISYLTKNRNFSFKKINVRDNNSLSSLEGKFNEIYHLASPASVTYVVDHPIEAVLANSIGTNNLLEVAILHKSRFLFASSSEVYGDPKEHPQKEEYWGNVNSIGIRSGYDEGKRFGEALCMAYHREKNLDVKIVRIFNTYGPNSSLKDTRVVPQLIMQSLKNEPLTIHGDGSQTRSFCYVSDMVEGIVKMMESSSTGPINLGSEEELPIIDVAKNILEMTGSSSKIKFVSRPQDDPGQRRPDITKAQEKLDWQPKVNLNDGLKNTMDYFKRILPI